VNDRLRAGIRAERTICLLARLCQRGVSPVGKTYYWRYLSRFQGLPARRSPLAGRQSFGCWLNLSSP